MLDLEPLQLKAKHLNRITDGESEMEQGRKVKEIFRVPTLPQGQNMCMSCRHANANEFNILLACLWEAAGASNKSLGNPHCGEIGQQGSKNK